MISGGDSVSIRVSNCSNDNRTTGLSSWARRSSGLHNVAVRASPVGLQLDDLENLVFLEYAWQRDLLRALLNAAEKEPIPAGTLNRTWQRIKELAAATMVQDSPATKPPS
jgi:hypothetical protein